MCSATRPKNLRARCRRAIAAVELAVCLPVLVLLMLGAIECSNIIFLRQALVQASYEAAKLASRPDAQAADVIARAEAVLTARNVHGYSVTLTPANTTAAARGSDVRATVTAPIGVNTLVPYVQFSKQSMTVSMTAVKH